MYRADLIRERRQALGVRPEALATAIGRSTASLYLYETGAVIPPIPVLEDIADGLNMSIGDFFEGDEVAA